VRVPVYDLATAVEVLTTGTYDGLPLLLKTVLPREPPSKELKQATLGRLSDLVRVQVRAGLRLFVPLNPA
jgi:hypothetical protein